MFKLRRLLTVVALAVLGFLAMGNPAQAHQPGSTVLQVSYAGILSAPILISADITLDRFDLAYHETLSTDPATNIIAARDHLSTMISTRVSITEQNGSAWQIVVTDIRQGAIDGYVTLHALVTASPPASGTSGAPNLKWDVVTDTIYSHKVFVGGISESGVTSLLGTIQHHTGAMPLSLRTATAATSTSFFRTGFTHFREGADHLLFLVLLAIGAARLHKGLRPSIGRLALLTAMFTIGHSTSLTIATLDILRPSGRWIETGIAVTIVLAAIHTVRPVVNTRGEVFLTLLFGFIHGFGFAGTLSALSLRGRDLAWPLFTFNIGLEAAQLLALLIVGAQIFWLARSSLATEILSGLIALVAASWVLERSMHITNPLQSTYAPLLASPERLAGLLCVIVVGHWLYTRERQPTEGHLLVGE